MHKYDLSVLIPARNEMFLVHTIKNVLENIRGNTEIIVVLDGEWSDPIPDNPRITILYLPQSIGQRAATNQACRLSNAKYVMKLDAHCTLDEGFDVKMIEAMQEDYTMIPVMYNLHAFDWVCKKCGSRQYQGPSEKYAKCDKCDGIREREIIFKPRMNKKSMFYRFDKTLHFQYWGALGERPEQQGVIVPSMSAQGSCFMLTREKYWELDICDEKHGSWGQQGVEVAMKTWLSGGQLMVNKNTWYAHMFRTQGGDFGFPYPLSGSDVEKARKYSRWLWEEGNWKPAKHDLKWLLDKFYPVPDWHDETDKKLVGDNIKGFGLREEGSRDIIFYTDNKLNLKIAHAVQKRLKDTGLPIVSASLKPMDKMGKNIHLPLERGMETYFKQIIAALEASDADIVYMCEHDVLYHPSHFTFIPPTKDKFYYNQNFWKVREDGFAVHWDANQVSGLVSYRELLLDWYKKKWEKIQKDGFDRSYEPGGRNSELIIAWKSEYPNIDIRHEGTLTRSKWNQNDFRDKTTCINWQEGNITDIKGWNATSFDDLLK